MNLTFSIPLNQFKNSNNGIILSQKAIENAVAEYQTVINEKRAFGGLWPPTFPYTLINITHVVKELKIEDDKVVGEIATLTSKGFKEQGIISVAGDLITDMLNNSASYSFKPLILHDEIDSINIAIEKNRT